MIPYRCVCGSEYVLSDDRAGKRTRCGTCRRAFIAPSMPPQEGIRPAETGPARWAPVPSPRVSEGTPAGQRLGRPSPGLIIGAAAAALGLVVAFGVVLAIATRGPGTSESSRDEGREAEAGEEEYADWDATNGGMVYVGGFDEVTVRGVRFRSGSGTLDLVDGSFQNPRNCFDIRARKGPIFTEVKTIAGKEKVRYFVFVQDKSRGGAVTVSKRYLDQIAARLK